MTFFIIVVMILFILYATCIVSRRCSKIEELQELEVLINDLDGHSV